MVPPLIIQVPTQLSRFGPKPGSSIGAKTTLVIAHDVGHSGFHFWWHLGQIWHQYHNGATLALLIASVPSSRLSSQLRSGLDLRDNSYMMFGHFGLILI